MQKLILALMVSVLIFTGCAAKRVIVKHDSCSPQPGMVGDDNCELIREM